MSDLQVFKWHPVGMKLIEENKLKPANEQVFKTAALMVALSDYEELALTHERFNLIKELSDGNGRLEGKVKELEETIEDLLIQLSVYQAMVQSDDFVKAIAENLPSLSADIQKIVYDKFKELAPPEGGNDD